MLKNSELSYLFELSKITQSTDETEDFLKDMNNIIEVMDMVKTVDKNVKPLRNAPVSYSDLREDIVYNNQDCGKIITDNLSIPKIM